MKIRVLSEISLGQFFLMGVVGLSLALAGCGGGGGGGGVAASGQNPSTSGAPQLSGTAEIRDVNDSGEVDQGDQIIVRLDQEVVLNGLTPADFELPVTGDTLGAGATVAAGSSSNDIVITVGASPKLRLSKKFDPARTTPDSPSGITVSGMITPGKIEGLGNGLTLTTPAPVLDFVGGYTRRGLPFFAGQLGTIELVDVDGDGDLDLVAVVDGPNSVWRNDGAGMFTPLTPVLGASNSTSVAVADVDGDGDDDLIFGNTDMQPNTVWLNDGSGAFVSNGQALGNANTVAVEAGDLDGDGDIDFVAGNLDSPSRVWLNDGSGQFTDSGAAIGTGSETLLLVDVDGDGDLDRDGDLDLILLSSAENQVWLNNGDGTFVQLPDALGGGGRTRSFEVADVDADGVLDVLLVTDTGVEVWLGDGTGRFIDSGVRLGDADSIVAVVGDLDGDGDLDVAVGQNDGTVQIWVGFDVREFFGFDPAGIVPVDDIGASVLEDVNKDGNLDLIIGRRTSNGGTGSCRVLLGDGAGGFTDTGQDLGAGDSSAVLLFDADGDGDLDLFECNRDDEDRVFLNDGSGQFTLAPGTLPLTETQAAVAGDVNGDGNVDLITGNIGANLVLLGDGTGAFTDSGQVLSEDLTFSVALVDLDRDGDLDFIEGNSFLRHTRIWLNDGGVFTVSSQNLGVLAVYSVATGDIDRDGTIDIVLAQLVGGSVGFMNSVWLNDGSGAYTEAAQMFTEDSTLSVQLLDADLDGDLDLLEGGLSDNRFFLNDGSGAFLEIESLGAGVTRTLGTGDIDRDGDIDIFVGNSAGEPARFWLNR